MRYTMLRRLSPRSHVPSEDLNQRESTSRGGPWLPLFNTCPHNFLESCILQNTNRFHSISGFRPARPFFQVVQERHFLSLCFCSNMFIFSVTVRPKQLHARHHHLSLTTNDVPRSY
ncbi:hypothetical protein BOTBODRAFT_417645 [Botryobasidium botryosum FD-172 SS1]|uniref:Uncharacterized protein n=1 Tax=Botryobasidium botryosum (strain FD-172 SS1) TaxID=930990 RepID=A0A067MAC4_BOTB1|nr:hypothetical protein BOTBODRAFT_417645 [Botryobasidium botryosum FD-172 SS1]